jgi:hypothetical protein
MPVSNFFYYHKTNVVSGSGVSSPRISKAGYDPHDSSYQLSVISYQLSVKKLIIEALAKILNVHPPQSLPSREGLDNKPSPLVGEGKSEG